MQDNPNKTAAGEKPVAGDIIDVLDILAKATNFSYTVTVQHQKAYGKKLPNGKWDGMIGALIDDVSGELLQKFGCQWGETQFTLHGFRHHKLRNEINEENDCCKFSVNHDNVLESPKQRTKRCFS